MDYFPRPQNCSGGIDVPLLATVPINAVLIGLIDDRISVPTSGPSRPRSQTESYYYTTWGEQYMLVDCQQQEDVQSSQEAIYAQWREFPLQWNIVDVDDGPILEQPPERIAGLLQSWGFFGLLEKVFDRKIHLPDWTRMSDPAGARLYVTWPDSEKERLWSKIDSGLSPLDISSVKYAAKISEGFSRSRDDVVNRIALSIQLLCGTILLKKSLGEEEVNGEAAKVDVEKPYPNRYLERVLLEAGCCPSLIHRLRKHELSMPMAYYLLLLQGNEKEGPSHTRCDDRVCVAHHIAMDGTYQTRHIHEHCRCSDDILRRNENGQGFIGVDSQRLSSIIRAGSIPLVAIRTDKTGRLSLILKPAAPTDEYTAISHVWADGLGNTSGNSLPACQLLRLWKQLERTPTHPPTLTWGTGVYNIIPDVLRINLHRFQILLSSPWRTDRSPLFWMDTLCIPVDSSGDEADTLKRMAIDRMNFTYITASRVFVLDKRIVNLRLGTTSLLEVQARIASSPWMRRSWTFQEGLLASSCYFQCADAAINPCWHGAVLEEQGWLFTVLSLGRALIRCLYDSPDRRRSRPLLQYSLEDNFKESRLTIIRRCSHRLLKLVSLSFRTLIWPIRKFEAFKATGFAGCRDLYELKVLTQQRFDTSTLIAPKSGCATFLEEHILHAYNEGIRNVLRVSNDRGRSLKRFIYIWNELAKRSTTKPEDVFLIFANLLDFKASQVADLAKESPARALQAMCHTLGGLPLDLLFMKGPRHTMENTLSGRWAPMALNGQPILLQHTVEYIEGHIWLSSGHSDFLMSDEFVPRAETQYVDLGQGTVCEIRAPHDVKHGKWDGLDLRTGFIIESSLMSPDGELLKGARVYIRKTVMRRGRLAVTAIYDCPVDIRYINIDSLPVGAYISPALFRIVREEEPWDMCIIGDPKNAPPMLVQRRDSGHAETLNRYALAAFSATLSIFAVIFFGIVTPMRIKIAVDIGWRGASAKYKASLIIWILTTIPGLLAPIQPYLVIIPVGPILFLVDRAQLGAMRSIDLAWGILAIIVPYVVPVCAVVVVLLSSAVMNQAWRDSFDEGWGVLNERKIPSYGLRYRLTLDLYESIIDVLQAFGKFLKDSGCLSLIYRLTNENLDLDFKKTIPLPFDLLGIDPDAVAFVTQSSEHRTLDHTGSVESTAPYTDHPDGVVSQDLDS